MIVIFGASSDLGKRLTARLRSSGQPVRTVSTRKGYDAIADLSSGAGVSEAIAGSDVIVSCAHARYSEAIIRRLPSRSIRLVLTGSAWRYSKVPNARADQVRQAEEAFKACQASGTMLHPTMIYGGHQENNIRRLLSLVERLPFIPAPDGGLQIVQPIYIDDVVECLFSAINLKRDGKHIIPVGGPPIKWREMIDICCASIGKNRPIVNIPLSPMIFTLSLLNSAGFKSFDANSLRRFGEDVNISIQEMTESLHVKPLHFRDGLKLAISHWRAEGILK